MEPDKSAGQSGANSHANATTGREQVASGAGAQRAHTPPWPIYVLGVLLTVFAGYMLFIAFDKGCLTNDQRALMRVLLSFAGGFVAWTFAGQIFAEVKNLIPGLIVTGAGGFGVFLVVIFVLEPKLSTAESPQCQGLNRSQLLLREYAVKTANKNASYSELVRGPHQRDELNREVVALVAEAQAIRDDDLTALEKVLKSFYQTQLLTICALTSDLKSRASMAEGQSCVKTLLELTKQEPNGLSPEANAYLARYRVREGIQYMRGLASMYAHLVAVDHGVGDPVGEEVVLKMFAPLPHSYLKTHNASAEDVVRWFCKKNPTEAKLCEA